MKRVNFQGIPVLVDRPKGFVQEGKDDAGKPWKRVYQLDYGYIPKTEGGDDEELDIFLGPDQSSQRVFWATQNKNGRFDEFKVFLGFTSKGEAKKAYSDHIPLKFLSGLVEMPIDMMKALLNKKPKEKVALHLSFLDELSKLAGVLHAHT